MQRITAVERGSIAASLHIKEGDILLSINGEPVLDVVDYTYLCAEERLKLLFERGDGGRYEVELSKDAYAPLGLAFESGLMSTVRACKNRCMFCFIDQMPKGGRKTLQFKDDDWRMSFIMGNYITLTNVDETEFERILKRRVGPLFVSVHATDPAVRIKMMRNPTAGEILPRLTRLAEAGLKFHCQIVCCPTVNDGEVLQKTLHDLASLHPYAQSVAVVPVGLTKFREGLAPLRIFTQQESRDTLKQIRSFAETCRERMGTAFVFASDEFYLAAGEGLPPYEEYEEFPQIENGVGLLRLFEREFSEALAEKKPLKKRFAFEAAGGVLAHPFMERLYQTLSPYGIDCTLYAIRNDFFGPTITVGGLVTGQDLAGQLKGRLSDGTLLLPHNMLKEREDVFLDGMTVKELSEALSARVVPVRGGGDAWVETIFSLAGGA
ncbi:MAG TPA: DUF512 domain-containing protein [Feifaniaceae bacterium]|nr:DUF512 domain-containing protein [Feifaniaceae bacterium]